jgi:hypothetical protein
LSKKTVLLGRKRAKQLAQNTVEIVRDTIGWLFLLWHVEMIAERTEESFSVSEGFEQNANSG